MEEQNEETVARRAAALMDKIEASAARATQQALLEAAERLLNPEEREVVDRFREWKRKQKRAGEVFRFQAGEPLYTILGKPVVIGNVLPEDPKGEIGSELVSRRARLQMMDESGQYVDIAEVKEIKGPLADAPITDIVSHNTVQCGIAPQDHVIVRCRRCGACYGGTWAQVSAWSHVCEVKP